MEVLTVVTLDQIEEQARARALVAGPNVPGVWYSVRTTWWTTHPEHVWSGEAAGAGHQLPCDPRGSVLMMGDALRFIEAARSNASAYGKHGLMAFEAAFSANAILSLQNPRPWCEATWGPVNAAIDRRILRDARRTARTH